MNAAIEDFSINKLGVVVMDELHMIDDESRGYILELSMQPFPLFTICFGPATALEACFILTLLALWTK